MNTNDRSPFLAFALDYLDVVNYALVQSKLEICKWCIVENNSDEDIESILLDITGEYVETYHSMPFRLNAGQRLRIQDINLQVNINRLLSLTERVTSYITLRIKGGKDILKEQSFPITFLAYNQWHGIDCYPQLLASFITPNHPCIVPIVKRASTHLFNLCGSSDFTGYISDDKEYVSHQINAIYQSLCEEGISYILEKPSYEEKGQRIRLANEVITEKLGNCMDLTLLFAACLEYIGINTLLILEQGHIYLGAWLTPDSHSRSVDDDITFLLKNSAEGIDDITVIESTTFAKAEEVQFKEAVNTAFYSLNAKENFQMFIDVYRCRLEGFHPLPQLIKNNDKWILAEEQSPYTEKESALLEKGNTDKNSSKPSKQLLWERKLLDFTMRNTLLNVKMTSTIQLMSVNLNDIANKMFELARGFRIDEAPTGLHIERGDDLICDSMQLGMDMINLVKDDIKNARLHSYYDEKDTIEVLKKLRRSAKTLLEENGANSLYMSFGLLQWTDESGVSHLAPILLLPVEFTYRNQVYHVKWRDEETLLNVTLFEYLRQTYEIEFDGLEEVISGDKTFDLQQIFNIIREGLVKKPNWNVLEECMIGIFSFSKFVMWHDIHSHGDKMRHSTIIDALVENDVIPTESRNCIDLDESIKPSDMCTPLPFDSSQLSAIVESAKGKSFILHGPPGTGKSQTITNMITNALYHGKRVLFVAEKMAALSVVQNRLEKLGLGDFCLELHSNKATKRHLIQQLSCVLDSLSQEEVTDKHLSLAQQLYEQRKELMKHVDALHGCESEDQFSLYESIMHYCRFNEDGMLNLMDSKRPAITPQNLAEHEYYIDRLGAIIRLVGSPSKHPLLGISTNAQTMMHQAELKPTIHECLGCIAPMKLIIDEVAQLTGSIPPVSLGNIHVLMDEVKEVHLQRNSILESASFKIFSADIQGWKYKMKEIHHSNPIIAIFKKWSLWHEVKQQGAKVSWTHLDKFIESLCKLEKMPLHKQISVKANMANMLASYDKCQTLFEKLRSWLEIEHWSLLSIHELETCLNRWSEHLDKLKDWKQWCLIKDDLHLKNMGEVATLLEAEDIPLSKLKNGYLARYFYEVANRQIANNTTADIFNGMLFDEKVKHYKDLALQFRNLSKDELFNRLLAQAKAANANEEWSNQSIILHKIISNNGRGMTIRRLFEEAPDILSAFCPCMLMSPISVAQFLEVKKDMFDLVIFDEASQIPTNEAVGAIARGKTVIIVGDTKQMPPTTFFTHNKTTEEEFDVDDLESILEDCQSLKMPSLLLSWHYRSKHESLISFSNNEYYENKLHTFPAIDVQERRVVYVPVKGTYLKGGSRSNKNEAMAIVNEIERRLSDERLRKLSIGVISFNVQQQYLIEDLLEARMEKNKQMKAWAEESGEPIFIKNLENVQGDERDVILFSIGYGPDKDGKISMNFGPLNLTGGERRLNVAVTRSRYEMMVFSSLHAKDIDLRRSNAKGVQGLHRFLDYAENGTLIENAYFQNNQQIEKVITMQIARKLEEKGLKVDTFIGKSRFKVNIAILDPRNEKTYQMGILLDDKIYHAIPTMSDREIVQPTALQSLGWQIMRVWTLDWFERPQHMIDTIVNRVVQPHNSNCDKLRATSEK
ncbi:MAG: DUF4011 domain-containing protein [Bacteroidaceae bacterium]|nr:DUF4011 domain-containing protein [Bacteroidaceae bacterium]